MEAHCKRYIMEFGGAMIGYTAAVPISIWLLKSQGETSLRWLYALLPVLPASLALWAAIRYFCGLDELQRRIQFESLGFSFSATCLIALTWGFLENAGIPDLNVIWVAPLLIALWGIGNIFFSRRYQ